jgi:diacylglycerol kinase
MTRFKSSSVVESISNAVRGLKLAISSQRNFVIEVIIAIIAFISAIILGFTSTDKCILLIMIAIVLVCEMLNSVIEFTLDAVYKNSYSKLVEMAKDMSAGMVLLVAIISVVVGIFLYFPYIIKLFL